MSTILIVSGDRELRETSRSLLRKSVAKILVREDMIDGLKELPWFNPDAIVWEFRPDNLIEMKVLASLRKNYSRIPVLLIVDDTVSSQDLSGFVEEVLLVSAVKSDLVNKVEKLLPDRSSSIHRVA